MSTWEPLVCCDDAEAALADTGPAAADPGAGWVLRLQWGDLEHHLQPDGGPGEGPQCPAAGDQRRPVTLTNLNYALYLVLFWHFWT